MTSRARLRPSLAVALAVGLLVIMAGAARAHSSLVAAAPGPGDVVGGEVGQVELAFDAGVSDAKVSLESPEGDRIEGTIDQKAANWIVLELDEGAISTEGNWIVRYAFISADGDPVELAYAFAYDSDRAPVQPLGAIATSADAAGEGQGIVFWAVTGALVAAIGLGAYRLTSRVRQLRSLRAEPQHR